MDSCPQAVLDAAEVVRTDAANTMQHDTTADLKARLMCRVDARKLGLVLAWFDQHTRTAPPDGPTDAEITRADNG